jgi:hypothetical protein
MAGRNVRGERTNDLIIDDESLGPPTIEGQIRNDGADLKAYIGGSVKSLTSGTGLSAGAHRVLLQLIHFIDEGPADGFASGATKTVTGGLFPTKVEWKRADATLLVEKTIERSAGPATNLKPTPITWKIFDTDGSTVLATVSDAITYSGVNEASRVRTIS